MVVWFLFFNRYNPDEDKWTYISTMRTKRIGVGCAVVNRLLYAVGGYDGNNRLNSVECYHPENDEWITVASMNTHRSGAGKGPLIIYEGDQENVQMSMNGGGGGQSHSGGVAYVRLKRPPFSASLSPIDPIFFTVA